MSSTDPPERGRADDPGGPAGPVTRVRIATGDVEEASELLRSRYVDHEPAFFGDQANFALRITSEAVSSPSGALQVDRVRHTMGVTASVEPWTEQLTSAVVRYFTSLLMYLEQGLLPRDGALSSPLVRAETFRHLATTTLMTFPHTALDRIGDPNARGPGRAEPATVRRAAEFIDAHAGEAIGLAEIAAAAGVGARSLQYAFARHRDTTPLGHLRRVRLERAHRDLIAADPSGRRHRRRPLGVHPPRPVLHRLPAHLRLHPGRDAAR